MLKNAKSFSSFSVNDLKKTREFYSEVLELNVSAVPEMNMLLTLNLADDQNVMIYEKPNHIPAEFTVLSFIVKNIDDTVQNLISRGVNFEKYEGDLKTDNKGIMRGKGPAIAWFKDPAGNILSVIQEI